jgi:hypothetical protein
MIISINKMKFDQLFAENCPEPARRNIESKRTIVGIE